MGCLRRRSSPCWSWSSNEKGGIFLAVAKMKLVSIIGRMTSLNSVVVACGQSGVFQPDDAMTFFSNTSHFTSVKEENPYSTPLSTLQTAVARAGGTLDESVRPSTMETTQLFQYATDFSGRIAALAKQRGDLTARLETENKDIEQFEHFRGLDIDLNSILQCETIKVRFGRLPKESFEKLQAYNENPYVLFFPGASDQEYYWGVYFSPIEFADEVDRIFSSLYFERLRIPAAVGTPEEIIDNLKAEREKTNEELDTVKDRIAAYWERERELCSQVHARLEELNYFFEVRKYAARYNDKFILAGWIPQREEKAFCQALDRVEGIEYSLERPDADTHHTPPVTLRNCRLFKPFEFFVDMYGLPRYTEMDPTAFIAITYTLLFGVMFADLGQGLVLALIGWLMWRFKKLAIGRVLVPCGISSAFFGVVFGSVFGFEHALDPLYRALFGLEEKPIEVMESNTTVMIMLTAVGLGVVLIAISMILNIITGLRQKNYENALFGSSGLAGLVFYLSLIIGVGGQLFLQLPLLSLPYVLILIVMPLILMFLREPLGKLVAGEPDWKPEKWGEFILQNFFEVFEFLLSYLSNTMSFLRVAAFVLVHAGMMMAVFAIGDIFHTFGYTVAVIVGNILVMGMEAVLVVIQTMRLEYYEMFSRYYTGDGRPFQPLSVRTRKKA